MIKATKCKYIKLGDGGRFEEYCIQNGEIHLGYNEIPHEICHNKELIREACKKSNYTKSESILSNHANQIYDFYNESSDTLWITFSNGFLYWCFADNKVFMRDVNERPQSSRYRKTLNGWRNTTLEGSELRKEGLRGSFTKTSAFRMTICNITPENTKYILDKINGIESEIVRKASESKINVLQSIKEMIKVLNPKDFELLVDLVLCNSGWKRIGGLGKQTKDIECEYILPSTEETAVIQVKSRTNQIEAEKCVKDMIKHGRDKIFFVYHTGNVRLNEKIEFDENIIYLNVDKLAELVLDAGLFNWLVDKVN